jgi:hypothetical protein
VFCPAVTSASVARQYGVGFVLEKAGAPGPKGAVFDRRVGDEDLYRIPDAGMATLVAAGAGNAKPGPDAHATVLNVSQSDPASLKMVTTGSHVQTLQLHITDVPGWHATIDGRPLSLQRFNGVMLEARIPPGRHVVDLSYWPVAFTVGIVLAVIGVLGLGAAVLAEARRGRRRVAGAVRTGPPLTDTDRPLADASFTDASSASPTLTGPT